MDNKSSGSQNLSLDIPDEAIIEIFHQAWAEAQAEARQLLKQKMLQLILDRSLSYTPSLFSSAPEQAKLTAPLSPPLPNDQGSSADTKRIQEEIDGIRQKLDQNEHLLRQKNTPPEPPENLVPAARDESPVAAVDGVGYYVYCVERNDSSQQELPKEGIDPTYPLYTIADQTLKAVVSQVSLLEFGEAPLNLNLHDTAWLESRVRFHQNLLDTLSSTSNIVPMRFCTIFLSEARVKEMLVRFYDKFTNALDYLTGRQEWGVKGYCDRELLVHYIEDTDESILSLKAEELGKSNGLAYFARKKLAETIVDKVERTRDAYAQDSHNRLAACAVASSLLQVHTKEATGRLEEMTFNGAYLIDKEKIDLFRVEMEKLANEYGSRGLTYDLSGPWPAYNFTDIGVNEELDE
jgi:hypothetical protein